MSAFRPLPPMFSHSSSTCRTSQGSTFSSATNDLSDAMDQDFEARKRVSFSLIVSFAELTYLLNHISFENALSGDM
jgi:hypothetical protein